MASCKIEKKKVRKTVEVEQEVYTLVLTKAEAMLIHILTGQCYGYSKVNSDVYDSLHDAGIDTDGLEKKLLSAVRIEWSDDTDKTLQGA